MLGLRRSVGSLSDIGQRLLPNISFHGQYVRFIRVGNTEIPNEKRLRVALQHIHGIGSRRAHQILCDLSIGNKLTKELTGLELNTLKDEVSKYITGGDLKRLVRNDIQKSIDIQSYRGYRHTDMLPCRGQRTKTNARTRKEFRDRNRDNKAN